MLSRLTQHPKEKGMSYLSHMIFALKHSGVLFAVCLMLIVHAFLPFIFTTTSSEIVKKVNNRFQGIKKED